MTSYVSLIIPVRLSPETLLLQCIQAVKLNPRFHPTLKLRKRELISTLSHRKHGVEFNPLNAELNPICHLLALLGVHHFFHVSRIRVKSLNLRLLMSYIYIYIYIYIAPILDVSRSHTTTHHIR